MKVEEDDPDNLSQAEVVAAIQAMPDAEYKRLAGQSAYMSWSVPGMTDSDLLHEALTRLFSGQRHWKRGVDLGATVYMIMESVARDSRKRAKKAPIDQYAVVTESGGVDEVVVGVLKKSEVATAAGTPETIVGSREVLAKLMELAAGDADEESVLLSWAEGLSGKEAADSASINMKEYDAARKRLNRKIAAVKKLTGQ
jgi:DNA-directed RNA polymerase specialized sigma24 family protein